LEKKEEPPWQNFATRQDAEKSIATAEPGDLGILTSALLGFHANRRDGLGVKEAIHTTVVSGRSETHDPRSLIVFYRSHLGGFGNLLDALLDQRSRDNNELVVQSDLSTVNLVTNQEVLSWLSVKYAGCASHARRAFAQYEGDDPDNCAYMLHLFKGLYIQERGLDLFGRNAENVSAVRGVDGAAAWKEIQELALAMAKRWSSESKLGERCRYILRNINKLTAYLTDPRLSPGNDFSERMLRMEKLIEANALFRTSLNGRFALDINRTILQTAIAAHAPLNEYVEHVLMAPQGEISANPEKFSPRTYAANRNIQ
jgi:hypothetical protein